MTNTPLTQQFMEYLRIPNLTIEFDRNLFGGQNLIRLMERRTNGMGRQLKSVQLGPIIVGEDGQSRADMLKHLAAAMEQAYTTD